MSSYLDKKIIFMGSPSFSLPTLKKLLKDQYNIIAVYTQPPKPVGRGYKIQKTPIHTYAESKNIPVYTPSSFKNNPKNLEILKNLAPDVIITIAYGLILPLSVLKIPSYGCLNLHASLLPRWRGASPMQYTLLSGDEETGVTLMQMDEGMDTGPMICSKNIKINKNDNLLSLHDKLSTISSEIIGESLPEYLKGNLEEKVQPIDGATYAPKINKLQGKIEWKETALSAIRQLQAFTPWPGVYFEHKGVKIKVLKAKEISIESDQTLPGTLLDNKTLLIKCGKKTALHCQVVQKAGKKSMSDIEFLKGYFLKKGEVLT